jgi:hypothetical protein
MDARQTASKIGMLLSRLIKMQKEMRLPHTQQHALQVVMFLSG